MFAPERNQAIINEVNKLLAAGFIREVYYSDWLANVVLVKKANRKWKMCVDFTNLNKAYPKRQLPSTEDRSAGEFHSKTQAPDFFGCILGI